MNLERIMGILKSAIAIMSIATAVTACCTTADRWCSADSWTFEDSSGEAELNFIGDTLEIVSPDGLTLWYNERLQGDYTIEYKACVVMKGGQHDRLSDLNCFWGAEDPVHPDDIFARSAERSGIFSDYNSLNLFYVGFGGNENTTTRLREYHGEFHGIDESKVKPLLQEYTDPAHLLQPNRWYQIRITAQNSTTTFSVDGEQYFHLRTEKGKCDGHFAIRLWKNRVRITDFRISGADCAAK